MNQQTVDISYVSDKLVIERLPCTIWPVFSSFLIFSGISLPLKTREISRQNIRNSENIGPIVLRIVR